MINLRRIKQLRYLKYLKYGPAGFAALMAATRLIKAYRKFDLKGQVVLVTGGSRGLGLIMARQLAEHGAKLVICARDPEELVIAKRQIEEMGAEVLAIPCDLRFPEQITQMVGRVEERFGRIDVLINNAGVIQVGPFEEMRTEDYEEAMKIHFWAPYHTILSVLPGMMQRKSGKIVNIVSVGGKISFPHLLPYNSSKFALAGFSEGLAAEVQKNNINVTTVYPGLMHTGSPRNISVKGQNKIEFAWFSILDSLPVMSMNAERAAAKIITAFREGRAHLTLTLPAKAGKVVHELFPELTIRFFGFINRVLLPGPGGVGANGVKGYESYSALSPSLLTLSTEQAARRNNEIS